MQPVTQLIHCKWIITCEPHEEVLADHSLVIQDGKIIDILLTNAAKRHYQAEQEEHYSTHVVMAGFVNTHTHLAMNLFRGLADDLALMDWLNHHIWPAEKQWLSEEFVYDASLLAMAEMIRSGTTCFNDMYFFLPATARAAKEAGLRANIGITVIGFPTAWAKTSEEYIMKGLAFYEEYKSQPLLKTTLAPHAIYTETEKTLAKLGQIAEDYDFKINMHVQETAFEVAESIAKTKERPLRRLNNLGLVSPRLIAVHMTQIDDDDLTILADKKPSIVHCPESNMKLASGRAPIERFFEMRLTVALGTDGAASNNDLDMISEMRSAAFLAKLGTQNPTTLPAMKALCMATYQGACALGIETITGSLAKGKSADFIAIDLDQVETLPVFHPASQIVYASSRNQVTDVWVAGKQLLKNRQLTTLDEEAIKNNAKQWIKRLKNKS